MDRIMQVLICVVLLCPFNGYGQESTTWSLERCINYAIENNIQLKQTRLGVQMAATNLVQSKANLFHILAKLFLTNLFIFI